MKKIRILICMLIISLLAGCSDGKGTSGENVPTEAVDGNSSGNISTDDKSQSGDNVNTSEENKGNGDGEIKNNETGKSGDDGSSDISNKGDENNSSSDGNNDIKIPEASAVTVEKKAAVKGDINATGEAVTLTAKSGVSGYSVINHEFKKKDTDVSLKEAEQKTITLSNDGANIDCTGAKVENIDGRVVLTIMEKGSYILTGTCQNGQVIIDSDENENVHLFFNGLDLSCKGSAPVYEKKCDKLIITLVKDSVNNLTEDSPIVYDDEEKEAPDAVVYAEDKVVINGDGELNIFAKSCEGIHSTDDVILVSGNINIDAKDTGIRGKDKVVINQANININSAKDGIKSTNSKEEGKGFILVLGGNINISSAEDGIQAENELQITGGTISILSGSGKNAAPAKQVSCRGLKAGKDIYVNGCGLRINACEDAIESAKTVIIDDGKLILEAGKKAIVGLDVKVNGGSVSIDSKKDGISAEDTENPDASNSSFEQNGGTLYVNSGEAPVDAKGKIAFNGGTIVAIGEKNKSDKFAQGSQNILIVNTDSKIKSGSEIKVKQSESDIITFNAARSGNSILISSPDLKSNTSYSVTADNKEIGSAKLEKIVTVCE